MPPFDSVKNWCVHNSNVTMVFVGDITPIYKPITMVFVGDISIVFWFINQFIRFGGHHLVGNRQFLNIMSTPDETKPWFMKIRGVLPK